MNVAFLVLSDKLLCSFVLPVCVLYSMSMGVGPVIDAQGCFNLLLEQPTHLQVVWQVLFSPLQVVPLTVQQMPAACQSVRSSQCLILQLHHTSAMRQTQARPGNTEAIRCERGAQVCELCLHTTKQEQAWQAACLAESCHTYMLASAALPSSNLGRTSVL